MEQVKKYVATIGDHECKIVTKGSKVFMMQPKRNAPRVSNCCATVGGKWEDFSNKLYKTTVDKWLSDIGAVESNFKGAPRGI